MPLPDLDLDLDLHSTVFTFSLLFVSIDERMIPQLLPETGDLETEDIQVFHWHIKDWKALEARSHGPVFRAGGFPW